MKISQALSIVFYYHRLNRYSLNALAGALDVEPDLADVALALPKTPDELARAVAALDRGRTPIVAAFSVLTCQLEETRRLMGEIRKACGSRVTIMAGGPHATADPHSMLRSGADLVCRGEAEIAFPEIVKRLAENKTLNGIAGLCWKEAGETVVNPRAAPASLEPYPSFSPKRGMFGPIEITRGCPFACSFCQTSHLFGVRPRHRSVGSIVSQAMRLEGKGRRVVRLLSPNAFSYGSPDGRALNLAAVRELLECLRRAIGPEGKIVFGYFPSEVRPEHVVPETLDLVRTFADNDEIVIGAQSGSERMLHACNRAHSVQDVLAAVSHARRFGFKIIVDFMFGLPGETETDARETAAVMKSVKALGARIHAHVFAPLPQTAFGLEPAQEICPGVIRELQALKRQGGIYGGIPHETGEAGQAL